MLCRREHWASELGDILTLCDTVEANILCRRKLSGVLSGRGHGDLHIFPNTKPCIPTLPREHLMSRYKLLHEQWINIVPGEIALRQYLCSVLYDNLTSATAQAFAHQRGEGEKGVQFAQG